MREKWSRFKENEKGQLSEPLTKLSVFMIKNEDISMNWVVSWRVLDEIYKYLHRW